MRVAGSKSVRLLRLSGLLVGLALLAAPLAASAQEQFLKKFKTDLPVNITADEIHFDPDTRTYEAKGNVRIFQDERLLTADEIKVSLDTRIGEAHGSVMITDGHDVMRSEDMEFNVDTFIGTVKDGSLVTEETNWHISGREISKLSDREYRIRGGTFTTCECSPGDSPSWLVAADEIQVTVDGYAKIRGGTFKVKNVPILYLPWAVFPVKTTRQSGLLFPLIGSSQRTGFQINLPFYWTISQNMDATFYADYLAERGFKPGLEYRYIFSEETKGSMVGHYIHDKDVTSSDPDTPFNSDRWAVKWAHYQKFPGGIYLNLDLKMMSDNQYLLDFRNDNLGRSSDRYLEANGFIQRPFDAFDITAEASYVDDLQSPDNLDRDGFILQRLPEITFTALPQQVGPLPIVASLDVVGTNFVQFEDARKELEVFENTPDPDGFPALIRNNFFDTGVDALFDEQEPLFSRGTNFDPDEDNFNRILNPGGTEGDGVFQEGEILVADGQRLDVHPRLAVPFRLGDIARVYPEAGFRETLYYSNENLDTRSDRSTFTSLVKVQSSIERTYDLSGGRPEGRRFKHVIEPEADWLYLSPTHQDDTPLFVPRNTIDDARVLDLALENRLRDPADRYPDESRLIGLVKSYLFSRSGEGRMRQLMYLKVGQGYDFRRHRLTDLLVEAEFEPNDYIGLRANTTYNSDDSDLDRLNVDVDLSDERGDRVVLGYRFTDTDQVTPGFENFRGINRDFREFRARFDRISQVNADVRIRLFPNIDFLYRTNYTFELGDFLNQIFGIEYRSHCECWSARIFVEDKTRPETTEVKFLLNLVGLGSFGSD